MIRVAGPAIERPRVTEKPRKVVTKKAGSHANRGRPRKSHALTAAERQRLRRARLKAAT